MKRVHSYGKMQPPVKGEQPWYVQTVGTSAVRRFRLAGENAPFRVANLVINEIMYNPISGEDDDEFVEIHNPCSSAFDLSGWILGYRGASNMSPAISNDFTEQLIPNGTTIAPGKTSGVTCSITL